MTERNKSQTVGLRLTGAIVQQKLSYNFGRVKNILGGLILIAVLAPLFQTGEGDLTDHQPVSQGYETASSAPFESWSSPNTERSYETVETKRETGVRATRPTEPVTYYTNSRGNTIQSPTRYDNGAPAGASAQCRDGSYSFSQSRRGTCSHHGGVAVWL